jgi:hypothetical protein
MASDLYIRVDRSAESVRVCKSAESVRLEQPLSPQHAAALSHHSMQLCLAQDTCMCDQGIKKETCTHAWWHCQGQLPCALFCLLLPHPRPFIRH